MIKGIFTRLFKSADADNRRAILELCEKDESAMVLDCGCGDGGFTGELGESIGTARLFGIETADEFRGRPGEKGVWVYNADLNRSLPIDDAAFDVICANQVIEHLYKTDVFVRQLYRVLKPGGYALISTVNMASWHNIFFLLLGLQPFTAKVSDEVRGLGNRFDPDNGLKRERNYPAHSHLRLFTRGALKELFQYHGFKVEKAVGTGYYPLPRLLSEILARLDSGHAAYITLKVRKA